MCYWNSAADFTNYWLNDLIEGLERRQLIKVWRYCAMCTIAELDWIHFSLWSTGWLMACYYINHHIIRHHRRTDPQSRLIEMIIWDTLYHITFTINCSSQKPTSRLQPNQLLKFAPQSPVTEDTTRDVAIAARFCSGNSSETFANEYYDLLLVA